MWDRHKTTNNRRMWVPPVFVLMFLPSRAAAAAALGPLCAPAAGKPCGVLLRLSSRPSSFRGALGAVSSSGICFCRRRFLLHNSWQSCHRGRLEREETETVSDHSTENQRWKTVILAAGIKFKALMFAYKTTSGSAPLYLNSLLQTYAPLEACVLQVNITLLYIPKRHKITFTDYFINCSSWWPAQLNPAVHSHLQESDKNTSLPSLFDPLTLARSILILFLNKKNTCPFYTCTLFIY